MLFSEKKILEDTNTCTSKNLGKMAPLLVLGLHTDGSIFEYKERWDEKLKIEKKLASIWHFWKLVASK